MCYSPSQRVSESRVASRSTGLRCLVSPSEYRSGSTMSIPIHLAMCLMANEMLMKFYRGILRPCPNCRAQRARARGLAPAESGCFHEDIFAGAIAIQSLLSSGHQPRLPLRRLESLENVPHKAILYRRSIEKPHAFAVAASLMAADPCGHRLLLPHATCLPHAACLSCALFITRKMTPGNRMMYPTVTSPIQ
jgi:hypothetical protein